MFAWSVVMCRGVCVEMGAERITEKACCRNPQMKKKEELIVVDALLEEGVNDGDSRHLCLDKTLLLSSGHM